MKTKRDNLKENNVFCGNCGFSIDTLINKKLVTSCYATGNTDDGDKLFTMGYICPKCSGHTVISFITGNNVTEFLDELDLYNFKVKNNLISKK